MMKTCCLFFKQFGWNKNNNNSWHDEKTFAFYRNDKQIEFGENYIEPSSRTNWPNDKQSQQVIFYSIQ